MARVTEDEVKAIIEVDGTSVPDLTPFITAANLMVTKLCSDSDYEDDQLELIELWLSAHYYAIRDPRASSEKAGSVSQNLMNKVDLGLHQTPYGQQAMFFDTAGNLSKINGQVLNGKGSFTPGIVWGGTDLYTEEDEE